MTTEKLTEIRKAEKDSHIEIYSTAKLFEEGSWLYKPVKTVMDLLLEFSGYKEMRILDLGCGVGRNCIPIARFFDRINCKIDCVDILDFAIEELNKYAKEFGVEKSIYGVVSSIDDFEIKPNSYDFIFAVSALEHVDSENSFSDELLQIKEGVKENGIVCLVVNSQVTEADKKSGEYIVPQFEVNLDTEKLNNLLHGVFSGWKILKNNVKSQRYDIPRGNVISDLNTNVVTFAAKRI